MNFNYIDLEVNNFDELKNNLYKLFEKIINNKQVTFFINFPESLKNDNDIIRLIYNNQ